MSVSFDFTYNILPQSAQNGALNALRKARVPELMPSSYFFTESTVTAQTDGSGAYGPVSDSVFNITTKMALANKKAFAVITGQVLVVPQEGSTTKVNVILKPLESINIGVPIKYFVYRGLKKNMFVENNNVVAYSENNTAFMSNVWADYKNLNNIGEDVTPEPFEAVKFGYNENEPNVTRLEKKFALMLDQNGVPLPRNLPFIQTNMHLGDFADNEAGFEIVLDNGTFFKPTSETGLELDMKYARAPFFALNINDIQQMTGITEQMYRENVQYFLDPVAFYGAHITKSEKGAIKVKNVSSPYNTKSDIYNNILKKFYNKNKVYIYITAYRDKSYNYDGYLGTNSLKLGTTGEAQAGPYSTEGWPILIVESQQNHSQNESKEEKNENKLIINLRFRTDGKQPLLYNNHGNNKNAGIQGNFLVNENLIDIENLATTEYTNDIEYGLINTYLIEGDGLNNILSIASFIYINFEEVNPGNLNDLFMDIDSDVTFDGGFSEEILRREISFKDRLIDQKGAVVLTQMKMIKDGSIEDTVPPVDNRTRLFIRKVVDSTEDSFINKRSVTPGFNAISNLEAYSNAVYGAPDYRVWKGVFTDDNMTVNSLMLTNFSIGSYITDFIQIGITESEYNTLTTLAGSPNISFSFTDKKEVYDSSDSKFELYFTRYSLGIKCLDEMGDTTDYPITPIHVYSIDGYYYFTKEYAEKFKYAEEFSKARINFETRQDYDGGFGFDWLRTKDISSLSLSYKKSIETGFEKQFKDDNNEFENSAEAYQALKKEYINIPTRHPDEIYYVPYLNIYPKGSQGELEPIPLNNITLEAHIYIDDSVLSFETDYDKEFFKILLPTYGLPQQGSSDFTIEIECLKAFETDKYIKIFAYELVNGIEERRLAGMIKVCKNSSINIKQLDIALINVETDVIDPSGEKGVFGSENIETIHKVLQQFLINVKTVNKTLNLKDNNGDNLFNSANTNFILDSKVIWDDKVKWDNKSIYDYLKYKFIKENPELINHFLIFSFGLNPVTVNDFTPRAYTQGVGFQNAIAFANLNIQLPNNSVLTSLAHEVLHGLGLYHTHREKGVEKIKDVDAKYVYHYGDDSTANLGKETDNIMSYSNNRKSSWYWQWKIVERNLNKRQ